MPAVGSPVQVTGQLHTALLPEIVLGENIDGLGASFLKSRVGRKRRLFELQGEILCFNKDRFLLSFFFKIF